MRRNVYRDDCRFVVDGTGREPGQAKAGYHRGDGILPFANFNSVWYTRLSSTNRNLERWIIMFFERKKNNDFLSINIENLIDWNEPNGEGCIVSDRITKEGFKVGYMYREAPDEDNPDSGWRFLAGNEDEAYMNESSNHSVFSINTICNYDRDIIPYIHAEIGSVYIRTGSNTFEIDDGSKPIFVDKQKR